MKILFELDYKNYIEGIDKYFRPSARALIIRDGLVALVYSKKYNYFKFPGGGMKNGENNIAALIREVKEEIGLDVVASSIKEYGMVIRKDKSESNGLFLQENYYYFCEVKNIIHKQELDSYELEEGFMLKWVSIDDAILTNLKGKHNDPDLNTMHIIERDAKVLKMLKGDIK